MSSPLGTLHTRARQRAGIDAGFRHLLVGITPLPYSMPLAAQARRALRPRCPCVGVTYQAEMQGCVNDCNKRLARAICVLQLYSTEEGTHVRVTHQRVSV